MFSSNLGSVHNLLMIHKLNVLTSDGISRSFDKEAHGFVRGEAVCVLFLQREQDSKRIYAQLLQVKCNNDGYKSQEQALELRRSVLNLSATVAASHKWNNWNEPPQSARDSNFQ